MGIFSKRTIDLPPPDAETLLLPDPKYVFKHLGDIGALIEAMQLRKQKPELQASGAQLAARLIRGFPDQEPLAAAVEQGLAASATRGFALASLSGRGTPISQDMREAVLWVSLISLPEIMRSFAAAHVFACRAGHFIGHHGDEVREEVLGRFDWAPALRFSGAVAVASDSSSQAWAALCGEA